MKTPRPNSLADLFTDLAGEAFDRVVGDGVSHLKKNLGLPGDRRGPAADPLPETVAEAAGLVGGVATPVGSGVWDIRVPRDGRPWSVRVIGRGSLVSAFGPTGDIAFGPGENHVGVAAGLMRRNHELTFSHWEATTGSDGRTRFVPRANLPTAGLAADLLATVIDDLVGELAFYYQTCGR